MTIFERIFETKKPKMQEWMTALLQKRFENFLICVVVNNQSKIQLRQTVLDKIKLDFLTKYPNKLVVLSEPTRDTPKSRESWANFCDRVIEISLETMEIAFDQLNESVRQETIEDFYNISIFRNFKGKFEGITSNFYLNHIRLSHLNFGNSFFEKHGHF